MGDRFATLFKGTVNGSFPVHIRRDPVYMALLCHTNGMDPSWMRTEECWSLWKEGANSYPLKTSHPVIVGASRFVMPSRSHFIVLLTNCTVRNNIHIGVY